MEPRASRDAIVLLMVLFESVMVLNSRSETESFFRIGVKHNRFLLLGTLTALGIHLGAMHWGPTEKLLGLAPLPVHTWAWLLLIATGPLVAVEIEKVFARHRSHDPWARGGSTSQQVSGRRSA